MAAPKKATHVVVHPKQYLAVGGKLQHVPKNTEIALTDSQAERLEKSGKVARIGEAKTVDLTPKERSAAKTAGAEPAEKPDGK